MSTFKRIANATPACLSVALIVLALLPADVQAQQPLLEARPDNCVSLRKGLVCYQRVRLSWTAATADDYCLLVADNSAPLQCWTNAKQGHTLYSFAAESDQQFQLVRHDDITSLLAETRVTVSWVYKSTSRRRRSWRLF